MCSCTICTCSVAGRRVHPRDTKLIRHGLVGKRSKSLWLQHSVATGDTVAAGDTVWLQGHTVWLHQHWDTAVREAPSSQLRVGAEGDWVTRMGTVSRKKSERAQVLGLWNLPPHGGRQTKVFIQVEVLHMCEVVFSVLFRFLIWNWNWR